VQAAPLDGGLAAARSAELQQSAGGSVLTRWHDYALASITPQFSWAVRPAVHAAPSVLDRYGERLAPPAHFSIGDASGMQFSVGAASAIVSETPGAATSQQLADLPRAGLQRDVLTPAVEHAIGDHGRLRLSAVLAYQRFASIGLGTTERPEDLRPFAATSGDSSFGTGARVDFSDALTERLAWRVGYQSRVDMSPFTRYRGVFLEPGDFDIPASASVGLSYALTPSTGLDLGVERVMYGNIAPFTSAALPIRFLALLGDGASPSFAWRNLDVYSLGWYLRDSALGNFDVRYTTRQQPSPTSHLLRQALDIDGSQSGTLSLGWSRATSRDSHLGFVASYASAPYFLGLPTYQLDNRPAASRLEFEAIWAVAF
jgi:hypothetical protein